MSDGKEPEEKRESAMEELSVKVSTEESSDVMPVPSQGLKTSDTSLENISTTEISAPPSSMPALVPKAAMETGASTASSGENNNKTNASESGTTATVKNNNNTTATIATSPNNDTVATASSSPNNDTIATASSSPNDNRTTATSPDKKATTTATASSTHHNNSTTSLTTNDNNPATALTTNDNNPATALTTNANSPAKASSTNDNNPATASLTNDHNPATASSTNDANPATNALSNNNNATTTTASSSNNDNTTIASSTNSKNPPTATASSASLSNNNTAATVSLSPASLSSNNTAATVSLSSASLTSNNAAATVSSSPASLTSNNAAATVSSPASFTNEDTTATASSTNNAYTATASSTNNAYTATASSSNNNNPVTASSTNNISTTASTTNSNNPATTTTSSSSWPRPNVPGFHSMPAIMAIPSPHLTLRGSSMPGLTPPTRSTLTYPKISSGDSAGSCAIASLPVAVSSSALFSSGISTAAALSKSSPAQVSNLSSRSVLSVLSVSTTASSQSHQSQAQASSNLSSTSSPSPSSLFRSLSPGAAKAARAKTPPFSSQLSSPILTIPKVQRSSTSQSPSPGPLPMPAPAHSPSPSPASRMSPRDPRSLLMLGVGGGGINNADDEDCSPLNLTVKTPPKKVVEVMPEPMNLSIAKKTQDIVDVKVKEEKEEDMPAFERKVSNVNNEAMELDLSVVQPNISNGSNIENIVKIEETNEEDDVDMQRQEELMETDSKEDSIETDSKEDAMEVDDDKNTEDIETKHLEKVDLCKPTEKVEYEEVQYSWDTYLQETGSVAAPDSAFTHTEVSLENGFKRGMVFEVSLKENSEACWLARLEAVCNPLLSLRWLGCTITGKGAGEMFWTHADSSDLHPLGWSEENAKLLMPPTGLREKIANKEEVITEAFKTGFTVPAELLEARTGSIPVESIKEGMILEAQHELDPTLLWPVKVIRNVGGRLLLRYEGLEESNDFWLFYLDYRLQPLGYGKTEQGCDYKPPKELTEQDPEKDWPAFLSSTLEAAAANAFPAILLKAREALPVHRFKQGQKVEALHPQARSIICPATVVRVVNQHWFIVEIDDLSVVESGKDEEKVKMCCHGKSLNIFPATWCQRKGLRLTPPVGYKQPDFIWAEYLALSKASSAPDNAFVGKVDHEFEKGMKLEAMHPGKREQICVATITRIVDNLMWIHLDSSTKMVANHIVDVRSHELYPMAWCISNDYPLTPPRKSAMRRPKATPQKPEPNMTSEEVRSATYSQVKQALNDGATNWCPQIYFNHRCFSGPFLSKGRIAELPKSVGPGPVSLVMKEVLELLINVAYKPSRVLREIQFDEDAEDTEAVSSMQKELLKAKYKGKCYRAVVELCKSSDQIESFCRQMCIRLECCPNLFSTHFFDNECPETCSQLTKTKYNYYYGKKKKRKIGRPPGGHTNLIEAQKPGKRRGRKRKNPLPEDGATTSATGTATVSRQNSNEEDNEDAGSIRSLELDEEEDPDFQGPGEKRRRQRRKYTHHLPPPTEIKTRGVKLPSYANVMFEKRGPRKTTLEKAANGAGGMAGIKVVTELAAIKKKEQPSPGALSQISPGQKRRGRPPKNANKSLVSPGKVKEEVKVEGIHLHSNPQHWSVAEVMNYFRDTDCANLCKKLQEQEIDGQALLLLNVDSMYDYFQLPLGAILKFGELIRQVKVAFFKQYA